VAFDPDEPYGCGAGDQRPEDAGVHGAGQGGRPPRRGFQQLRVRAAAVRPRARFTHE
jgi:hypothetical protein